MSVEHYLLFVHFFQFFYLTARDRSRDSTDRHGHSMEKDHFNRSYSDRQGSYDDDVRRHERDDYGRTRESSHERSRELYNEQKYDSHPRREYPNRGGIEDQRHRNEREVNQKESYDRNAERNQSRDWDHGRHVDVPHNRDNYESREWSSVNETPQSWDNRPPNTSWKSESKNWDHYKEDKWQDSKLTPQQQQLSNRNIPDKPDDHITPSGPKGIVSRRWTNWRGRGRGHHHDFRRIPHTPGGHHQQHFPNQEGYEERGDVYRRHINPQAAAIASNTSETHAGKYNTIRFLLFFLI